MDRTEIRKSEKAFLVGVLHGNQTAEVVKEHLGELKQLAETAGAMVVGQITQNLRKIDRKSTRLNSSHALISYAVFCLKKKTQHNNPLLLDS